MAVVVTILAALFVGRLYSEGVESRSLPPMEVEGLSCPDKPNCVSSKITHPERQIPPLPKGTTPEQVTDALSQMGLVVSPINGNHIHAEATSSLFQFVDDVDIIFPKTPDGDIHIRSASRVGYSDLGANAARVDRLRQLLSK